MQQEVDVWKPDVAQLFRAASPATHRTDVAAFLSPSTLSIKQALRKHFWGRFPSRISQPDQDSFPYSRVRCPQGVRRSEDRASPHPRVPTLRLSLHAPGCIGHQIGRSEGQKGDRTQVHSVTQTGASSDMDTPSWGSLTAEAGSPPSHSNFPQADVNTTAPSDRCFLRADLLFLPGAHEGRAVCPYQPTVPVGAGLNLASSRSLELVCHFPCLSCWATSPPLEAFLCLLTFSG